MQHAIAPDGQFSFNLGADVGEVETLQKGKRLCIDTRKFFDALRAPLDGAAASAARCGGAGNRKLRVNEETCAQRRKWASFGIRTS